MVISSKSDLAESAFFMYTYYKDGHLLSSISIILTCLLTLWLCVCICVCVCNTREFRGQPSSHYNTKLLADDRVCLFPQNVQKICPVDFFRLFFNFSRVTREFRGQPASLYNTNSPADSRCLFPENVTLFCPSYFFLQKFNFCVRNLNDSNSSSEKHVFFYFLFIYLVLNIRRR